MVRKADKLKINVWQNYQSTVNYFADSQLFRLKDVKNCTEMSKETCSNISIDPRKGPNQGLGTY